MTTRSTTTTSSSTTPRTVPIITSLGTAPTHTIYSNAVPSSSTSSSSTSTSSSSYAATSTRHHDKHAKSKLPTTGNIHRLFSFWRSKLFNCRSDRAISFIVTTSSGDFTQTSLFLFEYRRKSSMSSVYWPSAWSPCITMSTRLLLHMSQIDSFVKFTLSNDCLSIMPANVFIQRCWSVSCLLHSSAIAGVSAEKLRHQRQMHEMRRENLVDPVFLLWLSSLWQMLSQWSTEDHRQYSTYCSNVFLPFESHPCHTRPTEWYKRSESQENTADREHLRELRTEILRSQANSLELIEAIQRANRRRFLVEIEYSQREYHRNIRPAPRTSRVVIGEISDHLFRWYSLVILQFDCHRRATGTREQSHRYLRYTKSLQTKYSIEQSWFRRSTTNTYEPVECVAENLSVDSIVDPTEIDETFT